jgi:hypothetical protein
MEFLKTMVGKVATGLIALAVVVGGIAWWQTDPATRHEILSVSGRLSGWGLIILTVPWAAFWLVGWVAKFESNAAAGVLILALTAVEAIVLAWLFHWSLPSPTAWVLFVSANLTAGVYNLLSCDWIAEKME